jgi:ATP-binding cassette, subfamily B, bacterial
MYKIPNTIVAFLWHFARKNLLLYMLISVISVILSLANNIAWPYITGQLVDILSPLDTKNYNIDFSFIYTPMFITFGFWILMEITQACKGVLLAIVAPRFQSEIRLGIFNYIIHHSHDYFIKSRIGDISQRMSEMPRSAKFIMDDTLSFFFPLVISLIASSVVFFAMHYILSIIFAVWMFLYITLSIVFCIKSTDKIVTQSNSRALLYGKIVDSLANHLNIKIFTAHEHEKKYIKSVQAEEKQQYTSGLIYIEKAKILLSSISAINILLIFYFAIRLYQEGAITVGDIVFLTTNLISLLNSLIWASEEMPYLFYEIGVCRQSLSLLNGQTDIKEGDKKEMNIDNGSISFEDVTFYYQNNDNIFHRQSLVIPGGQTLGLVGLSGSGKTTFANLIMRLYDISDGSIFIDGYDISTVSVDSLRRHISFIPQDPFLFNRSIIDNIRYGNHQASEDEVIEAAKQAECHDFIMQMPDGYHSLVGERGGNLSGGQRQRIAIARAILKDSQIVIMDEATSALDSITEKLIEKTLKEFMKGKTVIIIAHRLATLANLDRIIVFDKGSMVEDGTHEELLNQKGTYAKLWNMQQNGLLPEFHCT